MENPIKKKSLIPRMFRAFTLYFFITLAVFFGYIELFGGVKTIYGKLPEGAEGEIDTSFSDFVANMMSLNSIYATDVDLNVKFGDTSVKMKANIAIDLATELVDVDATMNINGHEYNLGVVYVSPEVYVSIDDKTYRIVVETSQDNPSEIGANSKGLDFSALTKALKEALTYLNIDMSWIDDIQNELGIDFSNFNMASLLDQLDISTKKNNGEVKISIVVMNLIDAMITCDEKCNMTSATVNGINIGTNIISLNVPNVEIDGLDIAEKIEVPNEEGVIDLEGINDYVGYAENLFANNIVETNITVNAMGKEYNGKVVVDNANGLKVGFETEVDGYKVGAVYADEIVYLTANDFGVSCAVNDLSKWADKMLALIEEKTSKSVEDILRELLDEFAAKEFDKNKILDKVQDFANNLLSSSANFKTVLPSGATNSENEFVLTWDSGLSVSLGNVENNLSYIRIAGKDVSASFDFKVAETGVSIPEGCEDINRVLTKVENLVNYVSAGVFEFGVKLNYKAFVGTFKYANNVFELEGVLADGEKLAVRYENNKIYLTYGEAKFKFAVSQNDVNVDLNEIQKALEEIAGKLGVNVDTSKYEEILSKLSSVKLADLMNHIKVGLAGNQDDFTINLSNKDKTEMNLNVVANVKFANELLDSVKLVISDELFIDITVDHVEESTILPIVENEYKDYLVYVENLLKNDLIEAQVMVVVDDKTYSGKLNIDKRDGFNFRLDVEVDGYAVVAALADGVAYVKVNNFGLYFELDKLPEWKDKIVAIVEEKTSKTVRQLVEELLNKLTKSDVNNANITAKLEQLLTNLSIDANLVNMALPDSSSMTEDKLVLSWRNGVVVSIENDQDVLTYLGVETGRVSASMRVNVVDHGIETPTGCEDLNTILMKAENMLEYIEKGLFEFDFELSYNGLEFVGKLRYANGIFEIADVLAAGELANIWIDTKQGANGKVYFSYGNMKLWFDIPANDGSAKSQSIKQAIAKLTGNSLGVEINFGVFEEILNMISSYTTKDWKTNLVVKLLGNQDDINLSISNKKSLLAKEILTARLTFVDNFVDEINLSVYDVLKAKLKVNAVEEVVFTPYNPDEFSDGATDFLAGALDSLEVVPDVYGFSSDIAIRYSKTTFYGEIVAMFVEDATNPNNIGGFVPAVSIHTTSLGLNSFIYIVGKTLYIDINGLQISADLNKTTIDEVLAFASSKFGLSLASGGNDALLGGMTALKVILPAIDKISGTLNLTVEQGLQINIDDKLWYGEKSYFDNIVLQAFISDDNEHNIITPTKLVIGANIHDPNTLVYDDYSDAWLVDGDVVIETSITQNLNFGAYFRNISVGVFAEESISKIFAIEGKNYFNITSVVSNYGTTKLSGFNPYTTVLTLAETVYDYGMGLNYQLTLDGQITSGNKTIKIGNRSQETYVDESGATQEVYEASRVVVSVADIPEGQKAQFDLFGGKSLKVQGNVGINTNGTLHLVDLLYSNMDEGLYLTYTHGAEIAANNKFRAKISNANMSDIISMIVKFADLDLGDNMKKAWNIDYCTTDFSYIQSLLGIGGSDNGGTISGADIALNSVENITKMLGLIKLEKVLDAESGLNIITLSVELKLDSKAAPAKISLVLKEEKLADGTVVTKLKEIKVADLVFGGMTINMTVKVEDIKPDSFNYDTTQSHIDFSDVTEIVDSAVNTMNQKEISYQGNLLVDLGIFGKIELAKLHLYVKLPDPIKNEKFYLLAEYDIAANSVATIMIEGKDDSKRSAIVEYKDGRVSVVERCEKLTSYETKYKTASFALSELGVTDNLKKLVYTALGLNGTGKGIIDSVLNTVKFPTPKIEELITGFTSNNGEYGLELNGKHLTGTDSDTFKIKLKDSKNYNVEVGNLDMLKDYGVIDENGNYLSYTSVIKFLESISCDANDMPLKASIATISFNLSASNDKCSYLEYVADGLDLGGITYPSNEVFRENYLNSVRNPWGWKPLTYHTISFETGSEMLNVGNIESFYGDKVTLPQLVLKQETVGDVTTNYTFDGWFTESGVEVGEVLVLTADTKLVAHWKFKNTEVTKSLKIYDWQDKTNMLFEKRIKSGDVISLNDWIDRSEDWVYVDENGQKVDILGGMEMPEENIVVYKIDKRTLTINYNEIVDGTLTQKQTQVSLYQGENFLGALPHNGNDNTGTYTNLHGDIINFADFKFVSQKTGWFVDSTYTTALTNFVMPDNDLEVFAVDKQTVIFKSEYGNVGEWTFEGWPNTTIVGLPDQPLFYYEDDGNETQRIEYSFKGWREELSTIPMVSKTITAVWDVKTKYYYTIDFDVRQYRADGMWAGSYSWESTPVKPDSMRLLEGTCIVFNSDDTSSLDNAVSFGNPPSCTGKITWGGKVKTFYATTWGLSAWENGTAGGSGLPSYTVSSGDATKEGVITLYACWSQSK